MLAPVRIGPWSHGEARNGGVPDWALEKGWQLRSNDPKYLARVRIVSLKWKMKPRMDAIFQGVGEPTLLHPVGE